MITVDARSMYYKELNEKVKIAIAQGAEKINLININGQRFIGDGLQGDKKIFINGTAGNNLAAYMNGPSLLVFGNAQDGVGNTMNDGNVVIYGDARDTLGYAMRGGEIYVKKDVGYRVGIHMKGFMEQVPVIVIGGKAGDFFAEYMAGGIQIVLGLNLQSEERIVGNYCGAGMHGGVVYIRGEVEQEQLGKEVKVVSLTDRDEKIVEKYVKKYANYFNIQKEMILNKPFIKLVSYNKRPYGNLYAKW